MLLWFIEIEIFLILVSNSFGLGIMNNRLQLFLWG